MRSRARSLVVLVALTASTFLAAGFAEKAVFGQARSIGSTAESTPKTPWGAPDLQGTWSNTTVIPFERAKEFGNRELMNNAEYKKALDQLLERNNRLGRDSRESDGQDIRGTEKDVARAYNEHWFGDKPTEVSRRTSMIIDPPDGRMPALIRSRPIMPWGSRPTVGISACQPRSCAISASSGLVCSRTIRAKRAH